MLKEVVIDKGSGVRHQEARSETRIHDLIIKAMPADIGLTPLRDFKMDLSANPGFRKVFFSASCDCGTAALLSVEVAAEKTLGEVRQALPSLVNRLTDQAKLFHNMPCDAHRRMRLGRMTGASADHQHRGD